MATLPEDFWIDPVEPLKAEVALHLEGDVRGGLPENLTLGVKRAFVADEPSVIVAATPRIGRNSFQEADEIYVRCANGHPPLMFSIKCRPNQCYGACPICGWKEKR